MSSQRPTTLRPTLFKKSYAALAAAINKSVEWQPFSWELIVYYIVWAVLPPFAATYLVYRRNFL
jgi:hypothetical protein